MRSGIKLYSNIKTHETILELWGASTKHPDSVFKFSNFKLAEFVPPELQVYQWLLECASKLTWWFYAKQLADFANGYYWKVCWKPTEEG